MYMYVYICIYIFIYIYIYLYIHIYIYIHSKKHTKRLIQNEREIIMGNSTLFAPERPPLGRQCTRIQLGSFLVGRKNERAISMSARFL